MNIWKSPSTYRRINGYARNNKEREDINRVYMIKQKLNSVIHKVKKVMWKLVEHMTRLKGDVQKVFIFS